MKFYEILMLKYVYNIYTYIFVCFVIFSEYYFYIGVDEECQNKSRDKFK